MNYELNEMARLLKAAREHKGLNQRQLSSRCGVPQSQISRIEQGTVDLRFSSLVSIVRALEMEIALVPRRVLPVVNSILQSNLVSTTESDSRFKQVRKELKQLTEILAAAQKDIAQSGSNANIQRLVHEISYFPDAQIDLAKLKAIHRSLKEFQRNAENVDDLDYILSMLQDLRNELFHSSVSDSRRSTQRPLYNLEGD